MLMGQRNRNFDNLENKWQETSTFMFIYLYIEYQHNMYNMHIIEPLSQRSVCVSFSFKFSFSHKRWPSKNAIPGLLLLYLPDDNYYMLTKL